MASPGTVCRSVSSGLEPPLVSSKPTYLPGLNGIRALAASIVLLWHADQFAYLFELEPYGYGTNGMAGSAVTFFFVLSGFLITLLLLKEQDRFGTVNVWKFYGRRILRIWPVYYIAIVVALLFTRTLSSEQMPSQPGLAYGLYIFFLPNAAYALELAVRSIKPLWSVGVEEQFYLVWPWLFRRARSLPKILVAIILGYLSLKIGARLLENGPIYQFLRLTTIDSMAIGGLCAWLYHRDHPWLKRLHSPWLQVVCWLYLLIGLFYKPLQPTSLLDSETQALFYSVLIVNVSTNPDSLLKLENSLANFLGRISYGLYVYHMPVLCALAHFAGPTIRALQPAWARMGLVIVSTAILTTGLAYLSHRFFESWFLRRKSRLALVPSTDKAQEGQS